MTEVTDEDQDVDGMRVCIVSRNPRLSVDLRRILVDIGLNVEAFVTLGDSTQARMAHVVVADLRAMESTALEELRAHFNTARLVAVSSADEEQISRALEHGVHGWLIESEPVKALASAIIAVARGVVSLSLPVWTMLARELNRREEASIGRAVKAGLTPRQIEVIMLAAEGRTDREIAEALIVSTRTVNRHVADTLRKLGVNRRRDAIRLVLGSQPDG